MVGWGTWSELWFVPLGGRRRAGPPSRLTRPARRRVIGPCSRWGSRGERAVRPTHAAGPGRAGVLAVGAAAATRLRLVVGRCADLRHGHLDADRRCPVAAGRRPERGRRRLTGA